MFYMPTKVYEEKNCVKNHAKEIASFGKKALIVTGHSSAKKNGSLDDVVQALEGEGISYSVFDGIEENPSIETVMLGREEGLKFGADFVIGIGGGSPLDAAKAIALMIRHSDSPSEYLYAKGVSSDTVPVIAVPTTCGTGSEVTGVSVLTIHGKKTKGSISHKIFPALALIDGRYIMNAPLSVICNTAVDALTHLFESYVNTEATDYSRMCVVQGLSVWKKILPVLKSGSAPDEASAFNMMRASAFAGMAIAQNGTGIPHGLSYPVTYSLGMAHGKAVGYFTAGYLYFADADSRKYLLEGAGFKNLEDWQNFYAAVCPAEKIASSVIDEAVKSLSSNPAKLKKAPFAVDEDVLYRIANFN